MEFYKALSKFSGDDDQDVDSWIENAELIREKLKLKFDESLWLMLVKARLDGKAAKALEAFRGDILGQLKKLFSTESNKVVLQMKLNRLEQGEKDLMEFVSEVISLAKKINDKVTDQEIIVRILASVRPEFRQLLVVNAYATLDDFRLQVARVKPFVEVKSEVKVPDVALVGKQPQVPQRNAWRSSTNYNSNNRSNNNNYNNNYNNNGNRDPRNNDNRLGNIKCYNCGRYGHYARKCFKAPINVVGEEGINGPSPYTGILAKIVLLNGKRVNALIDTCAAISLIPVKFQTESAPVKVEKDVVLANGSVLVLRNAYNLSYAVNEGDTIQKHIFYEMPGLRDPIIGWDILRNRVIVNSVVEASSSPISKQIQAWMNKFNSSKGKSSPPIQHEINTTSHSPIRMRAYSYTADEHTFIDEEVQRMLKEGIIKASKSEYAFPVVIASKGKSWEKEKGRRLCINYKRLNEVTRRSNYPMPDIKRIVSEAVKGQIFSKIDLKNGYWLIPLREKDRKLTSFVTGSGQYEFQMMPMGICGGSDTMQRNLDIVLGEFSTLF
jgi:hypothetical protein